ncbi:MAG: GNAT family N-acetyltransferase [Actinomycetota bacterium]
MIALERRPPDDPEVDALITALSAHLWDAYPEDREEYASHNALASDTTVVLARLDGESVGCGAFRPLPWDPTAVEIKRMFVSAAARGHGVGAAVLAELDALAEAAGFVVARLETGVRQVEAMGLYEKAGYRRIPNYPPYEDLPLSVCYEKPLVA